MRSSGRRPFLDAYIIRARVIPAFIGVAPALAFAAFSVSWQQLSLPQLIASGSVAVLFLVFADLARRFGKRAEKKLFPTNQGRPFPTVLRHSDHVIDAMSKAKYLKFLATTLKEKSPTVQEEATEPVKADAFYARCGDYLRERTRDQDKYRLIFEENIVYGFRRNLWGLKPLGIALNVLTIAACVAFLVLGWTSTVQVAAVLVIAILHASYFLLVVTKKSVLDASDQYGRQLVLACEHFMDKKAATNRKTTT